MKKLTQQQIKKLWGEDGPYSQVNLTVQTRILDESVSRVFIEVTSEINPFTFEFVKKHRKKFWNNEIIQQLLDHSENQGGIKGYLSMAFSKEFKDSFVMNEAQKAVEYTKETILIMHTFVMGELGMFDDEFKA